VSLVNDLWTYRGLVGNLAQRELKGRYKRSILGWLWSLINPATTLAVYALVFGVLFGVKAPAATNGHVEVFALYLFAGLVAWNFFNNVVTGSMGSLIAAGPLLKKVFFPAECAPAANLVVSLSQAAIEASILVVIMVIGGNRSATLLLVPVILLFLGVFAFGIGLVLSVANVYLRDVAYLVGVLMNLAFYATPIVYTEAQLANAPRIVRGLVEANPIYLFVKAMRDATYSLVWPSALMFLGMVLWAAGSFFVGWAVFRRFGATVSEEL
jgi:ABC-2 type transport system permease protein